MEKRQKKEGQMRTYECNFCGKICYRSAHLISHLVVHTGERPYKCSECGKTFTQSGAKRTHMLLHTGDRPYICVVCDKAFTTSGNLKKHSFLHTGEKPYQCDVCKKSFNQSSALKTHMFVHKPLAERPHKCPVCEQRFVSKGLLTTHRRVRHCSVSGYQPRRKFTGNTDVHCTVCMKSFDCRSRLIIHMRTHTGEHPYKCELCSKTFTQSGDVKIHMLIHTGERPHPCTMCDRAFTSRGNLNRHTKTHVEGKNKLISTLKVKTQGSTTVEVEGNIKSVSELKNDKKANGLTSDDELSEDSESDMFEFEEKFLVSPPLVYEEKQNFPLNSRTDEIKNNFLSQSEMNHLNNFKCGIEVKENDMVSQYETIHDL